MLDYEFKQLEQELKVLEILKFYSDKASEDYFELLKIYEETIENIKKFKSVKYSIYQCVYNREKTHYSLLELNLDEKILKSRCGTLFDFDNYEEILEKVGTSISILFLKDSSLDELKLLPIVINNQLKFTTKTSVSFTPEFTLPIKDIKYLSKFMKKVIPEKLHNIMLK